MSADALPTAIDRATIFDARLVQRLESDQTLEALKDPAYQRALNNSRITAGASEREGDIDKLVELLGERASRDDRATRASVSRAVAIIDDVDESALQGLTYYLGGMILPRDAPILDGFLTQWSEGLARIPRAALPSGTNWLEHLHVLGAIRLDTSGTQTLRPFPDWMEYARPGFLSPGAPKDDFEEISRLCERHLNGHPLYLLEHELREGFMRSVFPTASAMTPYYESLGMPLQSIEELVAVLKQHIGLEKIDAQLKPLFMAKFENHPELAHYANWRGKLSSPIHVTHVGKALVWASLKRTGFTVPSFSEMLEV